MKKNFNISSYCGRYCFRKKKKRLSKRKPSDLEMLYSAIIFNLKKVFKRKGVDVLLLVLCLVFYGCDEHQDFPDMSIKIGHILCTDGSVVTMEAMEENNLTPKGVVFYTNNSGQAQGSGYAVALDDLPKTYTMSDTLGVSQGTSASVSDYDGNSNTYALFTNSNAVCPAANELFAIWTYGQSAFIPSVAEIRLLYTAKSTINPIIEELGGTPLPSVADEAWYWTSTEVENQEGNKIWLFSMASGAIHETPKDEEHKIRPIITLWY